MTKDLTSETIAAKERGMISIVIKAKIANVEFYTQQNILCNEGKMKTFFNKQNLREFTSSRPALK